MARQRSRRERTALGSGPSAAPSYEPSEGSARARRTRVRVDAPGEPEDGVPSDSPTSPWLGRRGVREVLEAIAITVAAALLFRTFVAEPFLIPTGSMAPGLMGRHVDLVCPECGRPFTAGASTENVDVPPEQRSPVVVATCPDCRFPVALDRPGNPDHVSFDGDRVVVSKFFYDLFSPSRWDVIVFKFPANPKINYIKRLIGLPGEWITIQGGDVHVATEESGPAAIARKSPEKLHAMLEVVDDTAYRPRRLLARGWPEKWQPWARGDDSDAGGFTEAAEAGWTSTAPGAESWGSTVEASETPRWLRFRQFLPVGWTWRALVDNRPFDGDAAPRAELVSDLSGYNNSLHAHDNPASFQGLDDGYRADGRHWVGDLAVEADVEVLSDTGTLLLSLVEAGWTHRCAIDVATGAVTVSLEDSRPARGEDQDVANTPTTSGPVDKPRFAGAGKSPATERTGPSSVRGPGRYRVRFANCDDELTVWVDGVAVAFDKPATFERPAELVPVWTESDPLDLAPAGVGAVGLAARFDALRVFRDIYYIADTDDHPPISDYQTLNHETDWITIAATFKSPETWPLARIFRPGERQALTYEVPKGYYFPMGDNSSHSSDARFWRAFETGDDTPGGPLPEHLLIGKATCVIWPRPKAAIGNLRVVPNVEKMRRIR